MNVFNNITFVEEDVDAEHLLHVLGDDDDLSAVLRGHLYIENAIVELIDRKIRGSDPIVRLLDFSNKVTALSQLKIMSSGQITALKLLAKLRNKFAHTLHAKITEEDAADLVRYSGPANVDWIRVIIAKDQRVATPGNRARFVMVCVWMDLKHVVLSAPGTTSAESQ